MSITISLFEQAQLAEATYANFNLFQNNPKGALEDQGFSSAQATEFLLHWRVVPNTHLPNTASGFSATVFESLDHPGEFSLAIRGSLDIDDFTADTKLIATDGVAVSQLVDLYNYWQSLTHTGVYDVKKLTTQSLATSALSILYAANGGNLTVEMINLFTGVNVPTTYDAARAYFVSHGYIVEGGNVYTVEPDTSANLYSDSRQLGSGVLIGKTVSVDGHSLGGHLAMAFARLFPGFTNDITAVNGLGFKISDANVNNLFAALGGATGFNANNTGNVYGIAGVEFAAMNDSVLQQPGNLDGLFIEDGIGHVGGHSATQMTDSLAVANLFIKLDSSFASQTPSQALSTLNTLFEKSSNTSERSLEELVISLRHLILGESSTEVATDDRDALYSSITSLQNSDLFKALAGKVTLITTPTSASEARTDLGAFLSLFYLTPFALKVEDAGALNLLYAVHQSLADKWNDDRNLTSEQIANGEANFSDMYLADRAAMLSWQNKLNAVDRETSNLLPYSELSQSMVITTPSQYFQDITSQTELYLGGTDRRKFIFGSISNDVATGGDKADRLYGMGGDDILNGGAGNDWLEGGANNDTLNGDDGADMLYGGTGQDTLNGGDGQDILFGGKEVDTLNGGTGNDQLKGGEGVDIYQFTGSYGTDVITDSDGQGFIMIDSNPMNSATKKFENIYKNDTTGYTFTKLNSGTSIVISKEGDPNRIIVNDWSDTNNLSINLTGDLPTPPAASAGLTGDFRKKVNVDGTLAFDVIEAYANLITPQQLVGNYVADGMLANAQDNLQGKDSNDAIYGLGGDDYLSGVKGDDYLDGGDGADILFGGLGQDTLVGGAGDDYINGSLTMFANQIDYEQWTNNGGNLTVGAITDTLLASGWGWIAYKDASSAGMLDKVTFSRAIQAGVITFWNASLDGTYNYNTPEVLNTDQGNLIDGGAGNDMIDAGTGNDHVHGGSDNDQIAGAGGEDILFGDAGNDILSGDAYLQSQNLATLGAVYSFDEQQNDIIDGGSGNDYIYGQGKDDILFGGIGNDFIWGDDLNTTLLPGLYHGNDYIDGGDGNDQLVGGGKDDIIYGGIGDDNIWGDDIEASLPQAFHGNDTLYGGAGNDYLYGGAGNDTLDGGDNDDQLLGGDGNDTLITNSGNDVLAGGANDDTYIINSTGVVSVIDTEGTSSFRFGSALDPSKLKLRLGSLMLDFGNGNQIHIQNFNQNDVFNSTSISQFEFADGTTLTTNELLARGFDLEGTNGDDSITGTNTTDRMSGFAGNDTLNGMAGDDVLEGGLGDDMMAGGAGDDTYTLSIGDGFDSIEDTQGVNQINFGAGVTRASVHASQYQGDDGNYYLLVQYGSGTDSVAIKDGMAGGIQSYHFEDGTQISHAELIGAEGVPFHVYGTSSADTLVGTNNADTLEGKAGDDQLLGLGGDDVLLGGSGADTLIGGADNDELDGGLGNDQLEGGVGQDSYVMRWGMGRDTVIDVADGGLNTIKLDVGVDIADLAAQRSGDDLFLHFKGGEEGLLIKNYYLGGQQWDIGNDAGETTTVPDFIAISSVNNQTFIEQAMSNYGARVKSLYYQTLGQDGYTLGVDGLLRKTDTEVSSFYTYNYSRISEYAVSTQFDDSAYISRKSDFVGYRFNLLSNTVTQVTVHAGGYGQSLSAGSGGGSNGPEFHPFGQGNVGFNMPTGSTSYVTPTGVWVVPGAGSATGNTNSGSYSYLTSYRENYMKLTLEKIQAGSSDNVIYANGYSVVDGGDGKDIIFGGDTNWTMVNGVAVDSQSLGDLLYGNAGDDQIFGGEQNDVLIGGTGNDYLNGGKGADTYLVFQGESGKDIIADSYFMSGIGNSDTDLETSAYMDWYYRSLGIADWKQRYFGVNGFAPGEGLPLLKVISPTDYAALAPLYAAGVITKDTVEFGSSITLADMSFSWGQTEAVSDQWVNNTFTATLDISWGDNQGVRIAVPLIDVNGMDNTNANGSGWYLGAGIEQFKFADGTLLSMAQMVGLAPPMPTFAPILFDVGSGQVSVPYLWKTEVTFGVNTDPTDIIISRDGVDLLFNHTNGVDQLRIQNWYIDSNSPSMIQAKFSDYTLWDSAYLTDQGLLAPQVGTAGDDMLAGLNSYATTIQGLAGDDQITGGAANDNLDGGTGNDSLSGGAGSDIYYADIGGGHDVIYENATSSSDIDTIYFNITPNDLILQRNQTDLTFVYGNDSVTVAGWYGSNGKTIEQVKFSDGTIWNSQYLSNEAMFAPLEGTAGDDFLVGLPDQDNSILGMAGNDTLIGGTGNDELLGGAGNDTMIGGLGDDSYEVDSADDVVIEGVDAGYDWVSSSVSYTLSVNVEELDLSGADAINGTGNALDNNLYGNEAANVLTGGAGNDWLDGGAGDDALVGGTGDDTYYAYAGYGHDQIDNTAIDNATATDTLYIEGTLPENVVLTRVANDLLVTISATDSITIKDYYAGTDNKIDQIQFFNYDANTESYIETLWDRAMFEALVLPSNHAPEVVGSISPLAAVDGSALNYVLPVATLFTDIDQGDALTYTVTLADGNPLPSWLNFDVASLTLFGTPDSTHIGNLALSIVATDLVGASSNIDFELAVAAMPDQTIIGTTGNNNLVGGSGNDILDGLAGTDTMAGGHGNDTYFVERASDQVIELANQGIDTINTTVTYTVSANVENLTLLGTGAINATGNTLNNILTGNTGNNTLDGKSGADQMTGGLGNDIYIVDDMGDRVAELENEGIDTVKSSIDYTLGDHVERLTLIGSDVISGTGNDLNNIIIGNDAANQLDGGLGNDNLNGGLGADTLTGGLGNDTYVVDNTLDVVIEQVGEGTDVIQASVTYTLAAEVENLTLTGTAAIDGTGNELNNTLTGNVADNVLTGGAGNDSLNGGVGADTMLGGVGNDIYTVDNVNDVVTELVGEGTDRVNSSIDYTLGSEIENLTLTGAIAISGTGNALNNTITGNAADNLLMGDAGNDVINGGIGADTMVGGSDNDTYTVDNVNDVVIELAGEGTDKVNSGINYTLGDNLENLTLTGASDIMGFGNNLANVLAGNTGNNYLYGLAANDTITGNNGYDILQGGDDNDTLSGNAGNNLLDGGTGVDRLTGGVESDLIIGGTGNDTITTGVGYDVIVFNKGDGQDIINASTGADNTISLGGNFAYSDLRLTKSTNNLILKVGATDQITLKDWYSGTTNKSVVNLQVIAEAMAGFNLGGADALRDNKVESFNFANIVTAFDAAGATANWQLTDTLLTTHLQAGSDTAAIGGDIAYQYGKNSNLTGMGLLNAQSVIAPASFGQSAQTLNDPSVWQAELVKLG